MTDSKHPQDDPKDSDEGELIDDLEIKDAEDAENVKGGYYIKGGDPPPNPFFKFG